MQSNKLTLVFFVLGAILIGLSQTIFIVDQTQQAIVLQLGQPVGDLRKPGLHFKLPLVQEVRMFDRRILSVDPAPEQMVIASTLITRPAPETTAQAATDQEAAPAKEETESASPMETGKKDEIVIPPIDNVSGEPIIVDFSPATASSTPYSS